MKFARGFLFAFTMCAASAGAQEFQAVNPLGIGVDLIASGGTATWAYAPSGYSVYEFNSATRSMQRKFVYGVIKSMSIGGGNAVQNDEYWFLDPSGYLYRYDTPSQTSQLIYADNRMQQVVVGAGYSDSCHPYEVWVTFHDLFAGWFVERYNFCTKTFVSVGTSVTPNGPSQIATGGGEVWALNTSNQVFRYNPATNAFVQMPGALSKLAVGVDGVWGLNSAGNIFEFNPVTQGFDWIPGSLNYIAAGGNGVWGINSGLQVYRYETSTRTFFQVAGPPLYGPMVVGTGGGVWSFDDAGNVQSFVTP